MMYDFKKRADLVAELSYIKKTYGLTYDQIMDKIKRIKGDVKFDRVYLHRVIKREIKRPPDDRLELIAIAVASFAVDEFGEFAEKEKCPMCAGFLYEYEEEESMDMGSNESYLEDNELINRAVEDLVNYKRVFIEGKLKVLENYILEPRQIAFFYECLNKCFSLRDKDDFYLLSQLLSSYVQMDRNMRRFFVEYSDFCVKESKKFTLVKNL